MEEIKERGMEALSLRTVAKACGVTHGTPYRHFESKENYIKAVLYEISAIFSRKMTEQLTDDMMSREKLVSMGCQMVIFAKEEPYFFEAMILKFPFQFMEAEGRSTDSECGDLGFQGFQRVIEDLIREESLHVDSRTAIFHLWSYITGFAVLANSPNGFLEDLDSIKQQIDHMLHIYMKGVSSWIF